VSLATRGRFNPRPDAAATAREDSGDEPPDADTPDDPNRTRAIAIMEIRSLMASILSVIPS
jgi:hypothetical protein